MRMHCLMSITRHFMNETGQWVCRMSVDLERIDMSMIKTIGVWLFLLAAFLIVNQMDYEDAIKEEQHYCDMVREGHWPAYKPEIDCKMVRGIKL